MNSMGSRSMVISLEEGWNVMQDGINNILEGLPEPQFTSDGYMILYTTIYTMCTQRPPHEYSEQLYEKYKETFEEYIKSTVLPSLRENKDELLLRELLIRWSNHKIMTKLLSRIFCYLDRFHIPRKWGLPSLEETGFLSFYHLVYDEVKKQVMDAILAMIDWRQAGEPIDQTLVNNALAFYSEIGESTRRNDPKHFAETMIKEKSTFYYDEGSNWIASSIFMDNTPEVMKMHYSPTGSSRKINLISSDGDMFEVDYDVALMSKTIEDAIETDPTGDVNCISLSLVSSKILAMVIEYCKKHKNAQMSDVDLMDWDVEFVNVHYTTLFDLVLSSNYMNINSLYNLVGGKIGDMIKGKTAGEIAQLFDIKDVCTQEEQNQ
ncbi:putative S-phase kinase-associated protein [Medicago truncatula]|uniref:Putative S-phase kinase-associated protein n=1 Tax=Medicago truncatula TaxID=3880 RepID=A0A396IMV4_MEDTR|nr:cullin-1 isoform X2 [Medicago truncatula]RHN64247.1 putative S-phase kinase-associated protein [Medicago truncatula]